jgi:hypothetical protein
MEERRPPSNWISLNRRLDELFGMLTEIRTVAERASQSAPLNRRIDELFGMLEDLRTITERASDSGRWQHINRRLDEVFGMLNSLENASRVAPSDEPESSDRALFVIGHARSGTTVLADALNTSDDVCCLMEPYFYRSIDLPDFAASFNSMHRGFGNPAIKGYWVPSFGAATGRRVIANLRKTYRYVGEKLAFRQREKDYDPDKFLDFAVAEFPRSPFICVIRDPIKVTSSVIDMFEGSDFKPETIRSVVRAQLETYFLILRLALTVPSFYLLIHENIDSALLSKLGACLSINLERAADLYAADINVTPHAAENERNLADNPNVGTLRQMYEGMSELVDSGSVRICVGAYGRCRAMCETILDLVTQAD